MWQTIVLGILNFIAGQIGSILGITQSIQQNTAHNAQEATPYRIDIQVQNIANTLDDINWGNAALHNQLTAIATALATRQSGSSPVILPTIPPAGYAGSNSDIANQVWSFILPGGADAGSALSDVYGSAETQVGLSGVRLAGFPWIVAVSLDNWNDITEESLYPPVRLDAATILPTDASILAWANRIGGAPVSWAMHAYYSTTLPSQIDQNSAKVRWFIDMTPAQFAAFQVVPKTPHILPVWPGLGKATFLTPHALADQLTITAPMDGIAIAIDSAPTRLSFFQFDDLRSYRNLGAISFFTDNGDQEPAQTMGFDEAIYTPKTMVRAAGVKIRVTGGVVGNIFPWTINP